LAAQNHGVETAVSARARTRRSGAEGAEGGDSASSAEARKMINVFQPSLGQRELEAVGRVFESNWPGKGRVTEEFERTFAEYIDAPATQVRSVSCCTEGLFQSIELLGLGPGDEVVLPAISFVAMANAVAARGATPVFCDVDARTLNATAATIEAKLTPRTRAVEILHYGGLPCELDDIVDLVRSHDLALIEDSACSVASTYRGRSCGTFGTFGIWSFDSMKILVTGDGGMMYFDADELAQRAEEALYLGLKTTSGLTSGADQRWWEFEIGDFGRRAIMNDISAAIGLEQLDRLPSFIERRREIHDRYDSELADVSELVTPPAIPVHATSSFYFYWIQTRPETRDRLARFLRDNGVYTTFRYYPLHLVQRYGAREALPVAEHAALSTLCIPIHQALSEDDVAYVVARIREFFSRG
jgi:dTDP-4-amino-4,6-dideoxygalactose transaminase